jgi:hypothetical protein
MLNEDTVKWLYRNILGFHIRYRVRCGRIYYWPSFGEDHWGPSALAWNVAQYIVDRK